MAGEGDSGIPGSGMEWKQVPADGREGDITGGGVIGGARAMGRACARRLFSLKPVSFLHSHAHTDR